MTQGPSSLPEDKSFDNSSAMDMVAVFRSENHDAEMEALAVKGVLDANGIEAMIVGPSVLPSLEFQVQVAQGDLARAEETLAEAEAAGPEAASEGEADSEIKS